MSKRKGVSAEDKRLRMLEIFHESQDFFQLKVNIFIKYRYFKNFTYILHGLNVCMKYYLGIGKNCT